MDPSNIAEENRGLRRTMRDLVALSTLPAVWIGLGVDGIARSLGDVLLKTLSLDLVYIRLAGLTEEVVRCTHYPEAAVETVRASLAPLLGSEPPATIRHPFEAGTLHVAVTRFGVGDEQGVLITGSHRSGFPSERDRLLLGVGANQTAIIVQRRRAEEQTHEQRERLHVTLASIGDAVLTTDSEGRVTFLNPVAEALTGWTQAEATGQPLEIVFAIINEQTRQPVANPVQKVLREGRIVGLANHTVLIAKDGVERPIDDSAAPIRRNAGEIVGCVLVFRDISEKKRAAAELVEADRRKDEFLATLAHELRNPLAPIRTGLQLIKLSGGGETIERARTMMDRQVTQMVRLVDDLMDLSRITRGLIELRKERIPLAAVVNSAVETSRPLLEQMGQDLTVTLPEQSVVVEADLTRLAQVFLNLLNNAAKYSEPGGQIRLIADRQGSDVVVSVRDSGIGIAADQLPRIFEMFSQVDRSLEKSQGGLGIGLTLVRRLTEMHGGTVEARSEGPGKGSEFLVRLPVVEASHPQAISGESEHELKSSLRILVVDDNQDGADSLTMLLKMMGNETLTTYDGEAAIAGTREFRPEVILLDIGLPKLNGYEACRRIRALPGGKELVIIAQTGWGNAEDRQRTQDAGFDHHIVKPVDPTALMQMLARVQANKK